MGSGGSQKIFVTVKSYSKRGQLLKRPDLQTLAESRDLDELVTVSYTHLRAHETGA